MLFSVLRAWIRTACLQKDMVLRTFEDLTAVLREGARRQNTNDPCGDHYHVISFIPPDCLKPRVSYEVQAAGFLVSRTYCVEVRPGAGQRDPPRWVNAVFSDICGTTTECLSGASVDEVPLRPGAEHSQWRKGFYKNKQWDQAAPCHGTWFTLYTRWESQSQYVPDDDAEGQLTPWQKKAAQKVMWLARRRAWQLRMNTARLERVPQALQDERPSSWSSSGESSSEDSSSSSSSSGR